jgi:hypothetical protein
VKVAYETASAAFSRAITDGSFYTDKQVADRLAARAAAKQRRLATRAALQDGSVEECEEQELGHGGAEAESALGVGFSLTAVAGAKLPPPRRGRPAGAGAVRGGASVAPSASRSATGHATEGLVCFDSSVSQAGDMELPATKSWIRVYDICSRLPVYGALQGQQLGRSAKPFEKWADELQREGKVLEAEEKLVT